MRFNRVPNQPGHICSIEALQFLQARGGGDVDFSQIIADHVDPDKNLALIAE